MRNAVHRLCLKRGCCELMFSDRSLEAVQNDVAAVADTPMHLLGATVYQPDDATVEYRGAGGSAGGLFVVHLMYGQILAIRREMESLELQDCRITFSNRSYSIVNCIEDGWAA